MYYRAIHQQYVKSIFWLLLLVSYSFFAQNWTSLSSSTNEDLFGIHFPTEQIGYAVGKNATIVKTTNAGSSWQNINLTSTYPNYWFWDVHFIGADTGFVVGESDISVNQNAGGAGIILRTYNGGANWTAVYIDNPNDGDNPIRDLFYLNKDTIFVCGGAEAIGNIGYGQILKSTNGGNNWTQIGTNHQYVDAMLGGMFFLNGQKGFVGLYESVGGLGTMFQFSASWLNTTNGNSMTVNNVPNSMSNWYFGSDFPTPLTGYMMRSNGASAPAAQTLRKTTNGGNTWTETPFNGTIGIYRALDFYDNDTGYVVGWNGLIIKTKDAGNTWTYETSGTSNNLNSLCVIPSQPNCNIVYAAGDYGTILKKTTCGSCSLTATSAATSICEGGIISLNASSIPGATYSWTGPNGFASNLQNPTITNATINMSGVYTVSASSNTPSPCNVSSTINITVNSKPNANAGPDLTICPNETNTLIATGGSTYVWDNGSSGSSISVNPSSTSIYIVTVSNGNCSDKDTVKVIVKPAPTVSISSDVSINLGQSVNLLATGTNGCTYNWSPPAGLSCTACNNPIATPQQSTEYCVEVTLNGCKARNCMKINIDIRCGDVFIPSAFSPNNDGENDLLWVYGNCIENMNLMIYNRWGEKVFETADQNQGWNGSFNGDIQNTAVFVYYLKAKLITGEEITKKGSVNLIR